MKRVLLLGTKSDDVNIFLWCLRQAQYTSIVLGNEQKNKENRTINLGDKLISSDK